MCCMELILIYLTIKICFIGRRPKNNKKNQKPDLSPQATSGDLDTSKLAAESSEHEVFIPFKEKSIAIVIHAFYIVIKTHWHPLAN